VSEGKVPEELRYTKEHEWIRDEAGELTVGITDHAQGELTDIVFVELPTVGKAVKGGESFLVLESVKTVADVYAPSDGAVVAVNSDLSKHPEWINQDPYGKGWIARVKVSGSPVATMSAAEYRTLLAASG
jgi:glycine cleavage system H protein